MSVFWDNNIIIIIYLSFKNIIFLSILTVFNCRITTFQVINKALLTCTAVWELNKELGFHTEDGLQDLKRKIMKS